MRPEQPGRVVRGRCLRGADAQRLFRSRIGDDLQEDTGEQSGRIGEQLLVRTPIKNDLPSGVVRHRQTELGGISNVDAADGNGFTGVEADDAIDAGSKGHAEDPLGDQNTGFRNRKNSVLAQNFTDRDRFVLNGRSNGLHRVGTSLVEKLHHGR